MSRRRPQRNSLSIPLQHYTKFRPFISDYIRQNRPTGNTKTSTLENEGILSLSTDLYDELNRRQNNSRRIPALPPISSFSDRRNEARKRLATLDEAKFKAFVSDIYNELEKRFPEIIQMYEAVNDDSSSIGSSSRNGRGAYPSPRSPRAIPRRDESSSSSPIPDRRRRQDSPRVPRDRLGSRDDTPRTPRERMGSRDDGNSRQYQDRIRQLEAELKSAKRMTEFQRLERNLEVAENDNSDLQAVIDRLKQECSTLREDYDALQADYDKQRDEIIELKKNNEALEGTFLQLKTTNVQYLAEIDDLKDEIQRLQSQKGDVKVKQGRIDSKQDQDDNSSSEPEAEVINSRMMEVYQESVGSLRQKADGPNLPQVLVAMKQVVVACRTIKDEADKSASKNSAIEPAIEEMSDGLSNLMLACKSHAQSKKGGNADLIMTASEALTEKVYALEKVCNESRSILPQKFASPMQMPLEPPKRSSGGLTDLIDFVQKGADDVALAISDLLKLMRSDDYSDAFFKATDDIFYIAEDVSKETLANTGAVSSVLGKELEEICADIEDARQELVKLCDEIPNEGDRARAKKMKQNIATCAYDVAKYTKEVLSVLEDASN